MVKEGYSSLPPEVHQFTDPALDATSHYFKIGTGKAKEGYNHIADVILEQYKIHSPTGKIYINQCKDTIFLYTSKVRENAVILIGHLSGQVQDVYATVSPHATFYFDEAKKYGKIGTTGFLMKYQLHKKPEKTFSWKLSFSLDLFSIFGILRALHFCSMRSNLLQ